jgi:error-prone DNA polymerase
MQEEETQLLISRRGRGFTSVQALRECGVSHAMLERLADADAFRTMGLDRRQALWQVTVKEKPTLVFRGVRENLDEHIHELPAMRLSEHVIQDYASTSLSLKAHPVSFVREQLTSLRVVPASELVNLKDGDKVKVAGLILVRQRPGTASGICFITLEDETGCANLVVFEKLFNEYRPEILQSSLLMVEGKLQKEGEVIHVIVSRCFNYSKLLRQLTPTSHEEHMTTPMSRADERSAATDVRSMEARGQVRIFPEGRNFR